MHENLAGIDGWEEVLAEERRKSEGQELDEFATPVEDFRPRLQAGGHPVEHRLVLQTRDPATVCGTARPKRTGRTCRRIAVIDLLQIPRLAFMVRR